MLSRAGHSRNSAALAPAGDKPEQPQRPKAPAGRRRSLSAAEPDKILRIRGLTYSPTEKGAWILRSHTVWGSHLRDIDLMKENGVRVIRTYYPITSKAFLDKLVRRTASR